MRGERNSLKRLIATPMPKQYFMLSYLLSRILMLVLEVGIVLGFGALIFHVPVRGSLLDLGVVCLSGFAVVQRVGIAACISRQDH